MLIELANSVFIPTDIITSIYLDENIIRMGGFGFTITVIGGDDFRVTSQHEGMDDRKVTQLFNCLKQELDKRDLKVVKL